MDNEIAQKQALLFRRTLAAFIDESRRSLSETKRLYQDYVDRSFAKLEFEDGTYSLSQKGQKTIVFHTQNMHTGKQTRIM